jgi:hypothetical protein
LKIFFLNLNPEIPLYRVITAKVTFGNIHALDTHVDHVMTIKNSANISPIRDHSPISETESACLLPAEDSDLTASNKSKSSPHKSTCVVDEKIFKIPSSYRCTNQYHDFDTENMFENDGESVSPRPNAVASGASRRPGATNTDHSRRLNYYGHGGVDDDDILLQLAIQQSVAMSNRSNQSNPVAELDEQQLTALEMLGHRTTPGRDTSGGTQSLQEYNERQNSLNEDLILQRVLAESLLEVDPSARVAGAEAAETLVNQSRETNTGRRTSASSNPDDEALKRILELSKREEEERLRREQQEEEELRKIIELSLIEK